MNIEQLSAAYESHKSTFMADWETLLKFKSISADPAARSECQGCAEYLRGRLEKLGFECSLLPTSTLPVVFAERKGAANAPTVLFYGHYDVQPPEPLELWKSDPFVPTLVGNRMYARGAQDNKGQLSYVLAALQVLLEANALPVNLKIILEGEEESGSRGLYEVISRDAALLKGDVLLVCDTDTASETKPSITMGLRGIAGLTVSLHGSRTDLHSGLHGGLAPNPATSLARLIATFHKPNGEVAVDGFYGGVEKPGAAEKEVLDLHEFDEKYYLQTVGVSPTGGERALTPSVRVGFRPTLEINGFHSGYGGPGGKTIIPATAFAKITLRLVPGQNPENVLRLVEKHLIKVAPNDLRLEISESVAGGPALALKVDSDLVKRASVVLKTQFGVKPSMTWSGGSIPVVSKLAEVSHSEPLLVGFGLDEDNIHAPNESFSLTCFRNGFLYMAMMLQELGNKT